MCTDDSPDSLNYALEVMYTSEIPALFLETDSGMLDQLHAAKDYSESGTALFLDGKGHKYLRVILRRYTAAAILPLKTPIRNRTP